MQTVKVRYGLIIAVGLLMTGLLGTAKAANYYWDTGAGAGYQPGNGIWDSSAFWTLNGTALTTWPGGNTNNAYLCTTTGTNVVTIGSPVSVYQLGLGWNGSAKTDNNWLALSNGTVTVGAGGIIVDGNKTAAIYSDIALAANQTWDIRSVALPVYGSVTDNGNGFGITKTGTSTLSLYGTNSFSGDFVQSAGAVTAYSMAGLPLGSGSLTVSNGLTLSITPAGSGSSVALSGGTNGNKTITFEGKAKIYVNKGTQTSTTFTFGNAADTGSAFVRNGRGLLLIYDTIGTAGIGVNGQFKLASGVTGVPVHNGMVDAYLTASDQTPNFMQYNEATGFQKFTYSYSWGNGIQASVNDNTRVYQTGGGVNAKTVLTNDCSVYALSMPSTGQSLILSNNAVLYLGNGIQSAGLMLQSSTITAAANSTGSRLDFGASEGIVYNTYNSQAYINVPIAGSGGVTFNINPNYAGLTLNEDNTYTGDTTIHGGVLINMGNGGTRGSLASTNWIITGGGLNFNRSDTLTWAGTMSGAGTVQNGGVGTLNLTPSSGTTYGGTLANTSSGSMNLTLNSSTVGTVQNTGAGPMTVITTGNNTFSNIRNGSTAGTLILNGAGSTNAVATVGYNMGKAWTLTVNGGVWTVGVQGANGTGSQNGGTFNINGGANYTATSARYGAHGTFNVGGVDGSGTLNLVDATSENGPGLGFNVNALNQGVVSLGVHAGAFALSLGQNNTVAVTNTVAVQSGGSVTVPGNMTIGGGTAMGAGGSEYDYVSLTPGGKLLVSGTIGVVAPTVSANTTRAFFWTGGQLTALAVTPSTNFNGVGSSIDSNSLMNLAGTLAPGDLGTPGKTTINGGYSNAAAAVLALDIGGTTQASAYTNAANNYDYVNVSGGAALMAGRLDVNLINAYVPATTATKFTVLAATGTAGALAGGFSNVPDGKVWCADGYSRFDVLFNTAAKTVILSNYNANAWNQTSGGTWDSASNWKLADPSGSDMAAVFGTALSSSGQVTLDVARTVRGLTFTNSAASYTIAGAGSLTLQGDALTAPRISVMAGSHTVSVPLALSNATEIAVAGSSVLTLAGNVTGAQNITKTGAGTLALGGVNTLGALTVSAGTVRLVAGSTTVSSLTLASGAKCDIVAGTLYILKGVAGGAIDTIDEVNAAITANTITLRGSNAAPADFKVTEETVDSVVYVKVMRKSTGTLISVL